MKSYRCLKENCVRGPNDKRPLKENIIKWAFLYKDIYGNIYAGPTYSDHNFPDEDQYFGGIDWLDGGPNCIGYEYEIKEIVEQKSGIETYLNPIADYVRGLENEIIRLKAENSTKAVRECVAAIRMVEWVRTVAFRGYNSLVAQNSSHDERFTYIELT